MRLISNQILLIALIAFISCSKSPQFKETSVSGKVINGITNETFNRGNVQLIEVETSNQPFGPVSESIIDEVSVSESGSYAFEFNAKRGSRFTYEVRYEYPEGEFFSKGDYQGNGSVERLALEKKQESESSDFRILTGAMLKFQVYNTNEFDENDELFRFITHEISGRISAGAYIGGGGAMNENYNENLSNWFITLAGLTQIEWHVTRNGQTEVFSDEITLEHNESRVYEIYY